MKKQISALLLMISVIAAAQSNVLFEAARSGDLAVISAELARGTDVNIKTPLGETPLIAAVEACQTQAAELLIKNGAQTDFLTKLGQSPLIIAAGKGCLEIVRLLLNAGIDLHREDPKRRYNALMKAAEHNRLAVVELLVSKGAQVNYRNTFGVTPLMAAAQKGHAEIVEFLLSKKADVNAATLIGYTALTYALDFDQPDIADMLLEAGANVKVTDNRNRTALMHAAGQGYADIVRRMVEKGADINAKAETGETALLLANNKTFTDIVSYLIEKGADTTGVKIAVDSTSAETAEEQAAAIAKESEEPLTPPEPIGGVEGVQKRLRYPKKARDAGAQGEVTLEVTITRIAQIKSIKIVQSFDNKDCDKAAETAVRNTRWKPAKRGKKTVEGTATITLSFKLDETN